MPASNPSNLTDYLSHFGLQAFRPGQEDVIKTLLASRNTLVVMPTGGGKSLCYQLPALVCDGVTLVISPLIALMKDQVDALQSLGIRAALINSTIAFSEQQLRLDQMVDGQLDMLYVVPERFRSRQFREALSRANVALMAIDEAHCISEWGHDFRPDYARLGHYRKQIGNPPTIALTATATKDVRDDIIKLLGFKDPEIFITGFARENLHYKVVFASTHKHKDNALTDLIKSTDGSGIVYAATRARCEEVAQMIADVTDRRTAVYHGGMHNEERKRAQDAFMTGEVEVIVATNAFGMGIDKADVRYVAHYNFPSTIEAYYQEAGRAGRDGLPAECLLLYSSQDRRIQEYFIDSAYPSREAIKAVYEFLCQQSEDPIEITQEQLRESLPIDISTEGVGNCEQLLEKSGAIRRLESYQNMAMLQINSELPTLVDLLPKQAKKRRKVLRAVENLVGDQRFEPVYIKRQEIDQLADLEYAAVSRALKEIAELETIDYVPPFRGRAIHLIDKSVPFEKLEIDFESLEARRKSDFDKLDAVTHYAFQRDCRQLMILRYFGDDSTSENCGHCDSCDAQATFTVATANGETSDSQTIDQYDPQVLKAFRIVLSGVARAGNRYGRRLLAQMLCGSKSKQITKCRLDKLSTYGLLSKLTQDEAVELIDAMISIGCLQQKFNDDRRPIVHLSDHGELVMREEQAIKVMPPLTATLEKKLTSTSVTAAGDVVPRIDQSNSQLHQDLVDWRTAVAEDQTIPVFYVLSNETLSLIASTQPQDVNELLNIKGIGEKKIVRYGSDILAVIQKHSSSEEVKAQEPIVTQQPNKRQPTNVQPQLDLEKMNDELAGGAVETDIGEYHYLDTPSPTEQAAPSAKFLTAHAVEESSAAGDETEKKPSAYWTWRCFNAGFSMAECMQIRDMTEHRVLGHLQRATEEGLAVEASWILKQDEIQQLEQLIQAKGAQQIRPLLAHLPESICYEHVEIFIRCREKNTTFS